MTSSEPAGPSQRWWGEFTFKPGTMGCWQVGPLQLWVECLESEWRITWRADEQLMQPLAKVTLNLSPLPLLQGMRVCRFSFNEVGGRLRLVPALADRPVVVKPDLPFFIPSGEAITLFVTTPVWVRIFIGKGPEPLLEIPTLRPSDTWFGPDTRNGELCYASRTLAHTRVQEIVPRPHRAVTPVRIRNDASSALSVERLSVPVPLLTLGVNDQGQLWTQSLTLERSARSDNARLQLGDMTLPGSAILQPVSGPRKVEDERTVLRALSRFFG